MFLNQKPKFFKTISFRLTFFYAILFVASCFFIFYLNYVLLDQSLKSRDHEVLIAKIREYASVYQKGGEFELKNYLAEQKKGDEESQFLVRIESATGKSLFLHIPEKMQNLSVREIEAQMQKSKTDTQILNFQMKDLESDDQSEVNDYETTSLPVAAGGRIQIARNTDDRDDLLERFRRIISLASILVLVIGAVGGLVLSNQALAPIRNLIQIMKRVRAGELNARVPIRNSNDELDEISQLFNKMTEKIERVVTNMQETLDQVAHEIKTPLTRLKSSAELVLLKPSTETEYKSALADTIENTTEIVGFINSMMDISEARAGVLKLNLVPLDSQQIISEIIDLYSMTAEEKNITIELSEMNQFQFLGDRNRSKQVFSNLLDNAIKYSKAGSVIQIVTQTCDQKNTIQIKDQGVGIAEEDLPRIWDRLFRGADSHSAKGLGLGLSLVQSICKAHGWKITAESQLGIGSQFTVTVSTT